MQCYGVILLSLFVTTQLSARSIAFDAKKIEATQQGATQIAKKNIVHTDNLLVNSTPELLTCQISRNFGDEDWFDIVNINSPTKSIIDQIFTLQPSEQIAFGLVLKLEADFQMAFSIHCFQGKDPGSLSGELPYLHMIISAKHPADPNFQQVSYENTLVGNYTLTANQTLIFTVQEPLQ